MAYGKGIKRSRKLSKQKKDYLIIVSGVFTLLILIIIFGLAYLSRIPRFHITEITTEGNSVTSDFEIEEIVKKNISGYYLGLFSKNNILIYPKKNIKNDLENEFRRLEKVNLSVKNTTNLHLIVKERKPDSLWCGTSINENNECYFVDSNGLIYSKAPDFSGNVFLKLYGQIDGDEIIGSHFLPPQRYQGFKLLQNSIKKSGLLPTHLLKVQNNDMELVVEGGGKIIYNLTQDMTGLGSDLDSILSSPDFGDIEGLGSKIDYIDMRFGNKIYYQLK